MYFHFPFSCSSELRLCSKLYFATASNVFIFPARWSADKGRPQLLYDRRPWTLPAPSPHRPPDIILHSYPNFPSCMFTPLFFRYLGSKTTNVFGLSDFDTSRCNSFRLIVDKGRHQIGAKYGYITFFYNLLGSQNVNAYVTV